MGIHQKTKTFLLRVTVMLTIQSVNLLYLQSTGSQGVPVRYDIQSHPTSMKTFSLGILTARKGKQTPFMSN